MYKYLLLISASAVPGAAYAQTASEQALEEIIAAQDEANEAGDQQATVGSYRRSAPAEAIITVTANGLGTDLRNTSRSPSSDGKRSKPFRVPIRHAHLRAFPVCRCRVAGVSVR